ncbi:UPF0016-domain-containing protein [Coniophora puteana RWD-64-598 SS2]|uniref:GDT1 family protein n=1 Tax=Coniophora puteana (strain RWD-64-598) TaxID=741705 RepID=A0A5M3MBH2_CONPW|nr:UPF0016-domain-containing protein [Coniophora puteana RWD-64-598 SS2]EIW75985.1 UPF0016-domain-containing protein [Coniophora puteana RWD-64-598 SS2]
MTDTLPSGAAHENLHVLVRSFAMIIVSEIGDKTFLIAAILAMRHPRLSVFAGAFGSLLVMSLLSAELGQLLPALIPKRWTQAVAGALFLVFGGKMLLEGKDMQAGNAKVLEEMREAEEEIEGDEAHADGTGGHARDGSVIPLEELEAGKGTAAETVNGLANSDAGTGTAASPPPAEKRKAGTGFAEGARNFCSLFFGPVFVQAFILTFLGEWGDRSQIATIALGAAHSVYLVTIGTVVGHSCCTALAVVGGRYVSTKISVKHVTLGGSVLFLLFGIIYLYETFRTAPDELSIPLGNSTGAMLR